MAPIRHFRSSVTRASLLLALVFVLAPAARGQSTATLQGTVKDEQGAVVPAARVTVHGEDTATERTVVTDKQGTYQVPALPVGAYRLEVRADGFKGKTVKSVRLQVAQTAVQDVTLAVGAVAEELVVEAGAPAVEQTTTSVGQVIDQRTVQEIPLNGRHFVDMGLLIPGSVAPSQTGFLTAPLRGQGSFAFNTAGNREDTVNFMINGINLNDQVQNQITFQPSVNTVSEFKVDNQTLSAEYGRSSGGVVNIATRSGTNAFHGEAFEFYRNQDLDARNYFNAEPQPQSPFKRNQFGAALGGPIIKNKTFFFATYEGTRQRQQLDFNSGVLSDAQRAAVTDPVVRNLLPLIPQANATSATGAPRFIGTGTANVNIDQWTGDFNHQFGPSDTLHVYYAFQKDLRAEPNLQGNTIPGFGDTRSSHRQIGTLNYTRTFGASTVNEARFGWNRINITFAPNVTDDPASYGINSGNTGVLPQITVQGVGLNFGGPNGFPQGRTDSTYVLSDTLTRAMGRHSLKLGGEYRTFHNVNFGTNGGAFTYPSLADFQAGRGSSFSATIGDIDSDLTQKAFGLFVQDNFRVRPNVTLELGLRWDLLVSPTESEDRFVYFDAASVSLYQIGKGGPRDKIYGNKNNLQPRVGITWDPFKDGRTSVRAAYAMLADQPVTNLVSQTAGNPPLVTPLAFTGAAGSIRLDNAVAVAGAAGLAPLSVDPDFRNPRVQTWNVNVQRSLRKNLTAMVGYFGSKGDFLRLGLNQNQITNGVRPYPRLSASSPILPNSALGNIISVSSQGYSRYDGVWVTANQRFAHGLQFNGSYTWSKSKDTNSLSNNTPPQDSTNIAGDYGPSDYDARHRYVVSAIWELPFTGNRLKAGWQISLITQGQTGNPIYVTTNQNFTGTNNTIRPDLIGNLEVLGRADQWYSTAVCDPRVAGSCTSSSVWALPYTGTTPHMGNFPRNGVYGPGFYNTDLSLIKRTHFSKATVELRAEAFNVFNHPNLGFPLAARTVAPGGTSFGVITATRLPTGDSGSARQIQFALKLLF